MARKITEKQLVALLRKECEEKNQKIVAQERGFSESHISSVLAGKRGIGDDLAKALGYERRLFEEIK